jgi:energy-coupling factor transporter ATP-binding protein EcfA2
MYLKRLEIVGFKSFTERTNVTFGPGISAVVGPNGCGKSNIIDAIRWVMGEQSPKLLRARNMEDLLFNGSQGRPPAALAEVGLTLARGDDPSGPCPAKLAGRPLPNAHVAREGEPLKGYVIVRGSDGESAMMLKYRDLGEAVCEALNSPTAPFPNDEDCPESRQLRIQRLPLIVERPRRFPSATAEDNVYLIERIFDRQRARGLGQTLEEPLIVPGGPTGHLLGPPVPEGKASAGAPAAKRERETPSMG